MLVETYGGPAQVEPGRCAVCGVACQLTERPMLAGCELPYCVDCARAGRVPWPFAVGAVVIARHLSGLGGESITEAQACTEPGRFLNELAMESLAASCRHFDRSWAELMAEAWARI